MRILKYKLPHKENTLLMPKGDVISVQIQDNEITMWVIVKEEKPLTNRVFFVVGTGHEFEGDRDMTLILHRGTVQTSKGLVWHVFERRIITK